MWSQTNENTLKRAEQLVRKVSKNQTKCQKQESRAVFLSMDEKSRAHHNKKRFVNRPGQFLASRKVEVSVKNLSQDELQQLEQANQNEIRQHLKSEVMEALKGNDEIRDDELMGMRWVATVNISQTKKVKARFVILSYQAGDLEDELLEAATPTPKSCVKHCFLQMEAHHGFEPKKADVLGVFLQGCK